MSLINSNAYIEPTAGTSLNTARVQQNNLFRSILTNFKSTATPTGVNLIASGVPIGEQDGMLFRSATTNALYISDTVHKKSSPVGGNFTRVGIGNRVENGIVSLGANATSYEIGELVATVSEDGLLASNTRLYLCTSNSSSVNSTSSFIDVGLPLGYSVGVLNNVTFTGQSVTAISFLATSNVGINTTAPRSALEVVGNVIVASNAFIALPIGTTEQRPVEATTGMLRFNTVENIFEGYDNDDWVGVGSIPIQDDDTSNTSFYVALSSNASGFLDSVSVSSNKLYFNPFTGVLNSTEFNSLSDARVKSNIKTIDNALDIVKALRGTSFELNGKKSIGVIAQEIEQVLPEVVTDGEYKSVAYGNIIAVLIEAVKELSKELEELKANK
jgi:hypothetical protein